MNSLRDDMNNLERRAGVDQANGMIPPLNAYQVKYYAAPPSGKDLYGELKTEVVYAHNSLFEDTKLIFQRMFPNSTLGPILVVVRAFSAWEELELVSAVDKDTIIQ